jgi:small nuclear ribonucleoprotein (snRNP)-like protein
VFLNIVLDEAVEEKEGGEKVRIGMAVRCLKWSHLQELGQS